MDNKKVAFIFDLDGVLVDTAHYHYLAWRETAEVLGFELTLEHNERLKGVSRANCMDIILEIGTIGNITEEKRMNLLVEKNSKYLQYISKLNSEYILEGVGGFIKKLKSFEIPMAIGSASKNAKRILKAIGLLDEFKVIIDGNHVTKGKPDPEVFLLGSSALGVDPKNCVVVEDALAGLKGAKTAGMKTIGIGNNSALAIADIQVNNLSEISEEMFNNLIYKYETI